MRIAPASATSQIRTVLSATMPASQCPSGLKASPVMSLLKSSVSSTSWARSPPAEDREPDLNSNEQREGDWCQEYAQACCLPCLPPRTGRQTWRGLFEIGTNGLPPERHRVNRRRAPTGHFAGLGSPSGHPQRTAKNHRSTSADSDFRRPMPDGASSSRSGRVPDQHHFGNRL